MLETSLIGKYFHTYEKDRKTIRHQGVILARESEGVYLTQLFEWLMGEPSCQQLATLEEITDWTLYDSTEDMQRAYDVYTAAHPLTV